MEESKDNYKKFSEHCTSKDAVRSFPRVRVDVFDATLLKKKYDETSYWRIKNDLGLGCLVWGKYEDTYYPGIIKIFHFQFHIMNKKIVFKV